MIVQTPVDEAPLDDLLRALADYCREGTFRDDEEMQNQARVMLPLVTSYVRGTLKDMGCETIPVFIPNEVERVL